VVRTADGEGCDVVLQFQGAHTCQGFSGVAVPRPVRILVRAGMPGTAADAAERLVGALARNLRSLGTEVVPPCRGGLRRECLASKEQQTFNLLAWVGSESRPDAAEERVVAGWLKDQPNAAAVAIVPTGANPDLVVPPSLRDRQVIWWGGPEATALDLASVAELDTGERRIFISYSHSDGFPLAHALARALEEARFDVFLDAFVLRPGSDFAERIEHELLDKAFLLLVETPAAVASDWVKNELHVARQNRLGIASVWPAGGPRLRGVGWARRWRMPAGTAAGIDPESPVLEAADAGAIRGFVIGLHTESVLRRRHELDAGLRAALHRRGAATVTAMPGGLEVDLGRSPVWNVSLRPRPASLLDMHAAARQAPPGHRALMVSATPRARPEKEALGWLADESGIPHWDEGRLRSLASKLLRGTL
jgi:TIR domain-containing protein